MALATGVQSLLFYVLACTPCYQVSAKRQEKKQAKRDRIARAILEKENPDMYIHPLPQQTNVFWSEEIKLGPTFHKNQAASEKSRALLTSRGQDSIAASTTRIGTSMSRTATNPFESSSETALDSVADAESNYQKTRYQRIEEEIWGHELLGKVGDAVSNVGKNMSNAGKKMSVVLGIDKNNEVDESDDDDFRIPSNPPVNELHPPIVANRPSKRAYQWMLQPPPPAKFMDGRSTVSRTPSVASGKTAGTNGTRSTRRRNKGTSSRAKEASTPSTPTVQSHSNMSEAELINSVIGQPRSRSELANRPQTADSGSSSDIEVVKQRRTLVRSNTFKEFEAGIVSEHDGMDLSQSPASARRGSRMSSGRNTMTTTMSYEMQPPMSISSTAPVLPHIVV